MLNKSVLGFLFSFLLFLSPAYLIFPMGYKENELNGNKLFKVSNFEGASEEYSEGLTKKANYDLYYNRGVSYYKLGQYDKSYSDFEDAATYANDRGDQIKAVYNAGNSNYMLAETIKTENPGQALEYYGKAVNHFERVLELDADNPDASYNLELSRVRLDELKQHENEEQEDGDQQSEDQQDGEQQDGNEQDGEEQAQQNSDQQDAEQQDSNQQQEEQQQNESSESAFSSEEISPKDILNEEARRQEEIQAVIINGSGELVDKDW